MLYTLFISNLLFFLSFGALQISLFPHDSSIVANEENCRNQPEITISPDYESFVNGDQILPCVYGHLTSGSILTYKWIQHDSNRTVK